MAEAGLPPVGKIVPSGKVERIHIDGDARGSRNGWYVLHLDERPAGMFGSWRTGAEHRWSANGGESHIPNVLRRIEWREQMDRSRRERLLEQHRTAEAAAKAARKTWAEAEPASGRMHYLQRKQIQPYDLRADYRSLLVPLYSTKYGMRGLQRIFTDGTKRFTPGMSVGGCYYPIGAPQDGILLICEGMATGHTLHEATGHAVAAAMSCGNMPIAARALHEKHPSLQLVFCADHDAHGRGLGAAEQAAIRTGGGLILYPEQAGQDFNDLACEHGSKAVRDLVLPHLNEMAGAA